MLHDLVLALYGVGGQIFAEGRAFRSAPDFPFLHEGERAVVDGALAEVCEAFRRVQIAVNPSATGAGASASGAFAEGMLHVTCGMIFFSFTHSTNYSSRTVIIVLACTRSSGGHVCYYAVHGSVAEC